MKIFVYIINSFLILGIIVYITIVSIQSMDTTTISTNLNIKRLRSSELIEYMESQKEVDVEEKVAEDDSMSLEEKKEEDNFSQKDDTTAEDKEMEVVEETSSYIPEPVSDVLETQIGSLSGYGPDCYGCSGYLASGRYVGNGNIYYSDSTYGAVRILAGDSSYPFGTIVRIKNSKFSEFIGIVLDRGGGVGFGKSHLFDLLFPTSAEAAANAVSYNTTFEILRYGYQEQDKRMKF